MVKKLGVIAVLVLVLVVAVGWVWWRRGQSVPVKFEAEDKPQVSMNKPEGPPVFIPDKKAGVGGARWELRWFQPTLEQLAQKDGAIIMVTGYTDSSGVKRTQKVFAGGKYSGEEIPVVLTPDGSKQDGLEARVEKLKALEGKRVSIEYLAKVDNFEQVYESFCNQPPMPKRICSIAPLVTPYNQNYDSFAQGQPILDENIYVFANLVSEELVNE